MRVDYRLFLVFFRFIRTLAGLLWLLLFWFFFFRFWFYFNPFVLLIIKQFFDQLLLHLVIVIILLVLLIGCLIIDRTSRRRAHNVRDGVDLHLFDQSLGFLIQKRALFGLEFGKFEVIHIFQSSFFKILNLGFGLFLSLLRLIVAHVHHF